jgi:anti-sigma regulatory factor (Ser/Thr protein kinase)
MDQQQFGQPDHGAEVAELRTAPRPRVDLRLEVPAVSEQVADIRQAVRTAARAQGIAEPQLGDIGLAVTEACANVVTHAYRDAPRAGPLTVEAYRERRDFVVTVTDWGPGISPRADSNGLGLGLALIARLTRRMEITSNAPTGSTILMAFLLAEA